MLRIFTHKKKMVSLVFFGDILQLPHTVISNSEILTHPNMYSTLYRGRNLISL